MSFILSSECIEPKVFLFLAFLFSFYTFSLFVCDLLDQCFCIDFEDKWNETEENQVVRQNKRWLIVFSVLAKIYHSFQCHCTKSFHSVLPLTRSSISWWIGRHFFTFPFSFLCILFLESAPSFLTPMPKFFSSSIIWYLVASGWTRTDGSDGSRLLMIHSCWLT